MEKDRKQTSLFCWSSFFPYSMHDYNRLFKIFLFCSSNWPKDNETELIFSVIFIFKLNFGYSHEEKQVL
jgi:hypothetical protein